MKFICILFSSLLITAQAFGQNQEKAKFIKVGYLQPIYLFDPIDRVSGTLTIDYVKETKHFLGYEVGLRNFSFAKNESYYSYNSSFDCGIHLQTSILLFKKESYKIKPLFGITVDNIMFVNRTKAKPSSSSLNSNYVSYLLIQNLTSGFRYKFSEKIQLDLTIDLNAYTFIGSYNKTENPNVNTNQQRILTADFYALNGFDNFKLGVRFKI